MHVRWAGAIVLGLAIAGTGSSQAATVGLCNCCLEQMPAACSTACSKIPSVPGQCPAFVIYDAKGAVGPNGNPLTAMSLKDLSLGDPNNRQLENFRRFLERNRRRAIRDWRRDEHLYKRGMLSRETFETHDKLYRDALVNYYHGIRAYKVKLGKIID